MASQSGYHDAGRSASPKLRSRDLPSKRLLGTGLASVGYETELNGRKCARKDFMGVPSRTFKREAARLVGLEDHINVVKTLDWTENKMSCSLVLEYMDDDLLGFLQKRKQSQGSLKAGPNSGNQSDLDSRNTIKLAPFELREALDFMLQIARGMEFLSDKGIRHGNLKSKNILVTRTNDRDRNSWSVKVADFGLVRTRRKSTSFASRQARKLDMARWTAPELLEVFLLEDKGETSSESDSDEDCTDSSDVADSDVPEWRELGADVYSFAVTCSQILTGEDPYPTDLNWKELGVNIVSHGLTPTLPAACPAELRELLESCWGCDPFCHYLRKRPSFSHIRETLERLQRMRKPDHLPKEEPMYNKRKFLLREAIPWKKPTDVVRVAGLRESTLWKEPTTVVRVAGLRESILWKEPTTVVRVAGPREPITVENLWYSNWPLRREWPRDIPAGKGWLSEYQILIFDVARLITSTRMVVSYGIQWNRLREELQLMLPDLLRIRNRWISCEKTLGVQGFNDLTMTTPLHAWSTQLISEVDHLFREVKKYEGDRALEHVYTPLYAGLLVTVVLVPTLLPALIVPPFIVPVLMGPWRAPNLGNDINRLLKQRTEIMRDLTTVLRQAQVQAKEQTKVVDVYSTCSPNSPKVSRDRWRAKA